jgi:hypothetical protein
MGAIVYVAYPFFHRRQDEGPSPTMQKLNDLMLRKEAIYASIKDLDFDYRMGKLPEEEHRRLVSECKKEAAAVLAAIDRLNGRGGQTVREEARRPQNVTAHGTVFCTNCGSRQQMTDTFCANCGQKLRT